MPPGPPPGGRSVSGERGAQPGGAAKPEKPAAEYGLLAGKGGSSLLEVDGQSVACDFAADRSSSISILLRGGASLTGSINADGAAKFASLVVEAGSVWIVSADSCLDSLSAEIGAGGKSVVNIRGNGHRVSYDAKSNPGLGGKSYQLSGGGSLVPE